MIVFLKTADIVAILLGAFFATHFGEFRVGAFAESSASQIAFVAALALSVFPTFGCYRPSSFASVWKLMARAMAALAFVQTCGFALAWFSPNSHVTVGSWVAAWTIISGAAMIACRPLVRYLTARGRDAKAMPFAEEHRAVAVPSAPLQRALKRALDVIVSTLLLLILLPVFAVICILIRRDDGPLIFSHERIGRGGKKFKCMKFRTMVPNADVVLERLLATDADAREMWEREFKLKEDVRITSVGRFLRATSMDELPQLWNVLRGDMSLVGPRPIVERELQKYGVSASVYLSAIPGMTGLWQISGRNDVDYETRVNLDTSYVKNWSLVEDFRILLKTFDVVVRRVGAY
ncbi:sugar transferase [Paraburkholderia sediminicola]|uniref:sugar transferase n=1 Tax=Paraburkholderia sediminicola TaxID=458836 RepID=UPI0038B6FED2